MATRYSAAYNGKCASADAPFHFRILHGFPEPLEECAWREFLSRSDWPSHYTSPEYFLEPYWRGRNPFAVLAYERDRIVGVLTGLHEGNHAVSGLLSRPQVCFDRTTNIFNAAQTLAQGLLEESGSAELVTFYSWSRVESLPDAGFRLRPMEGDVILDLTRGPDTLLREMHMSQRKNVRIAVRKGVEIIEASSEEDYCAYYDVYCGWLHTTRKKITEDQIPLQAAMEAYKLRKNRRVFLARHEGKTIVRGFGPFFAGRASRIFRKSFPGRVFPAKAQ